MSVVWKAIFLKRNFLVIRTSCFAVLILGVGYSFWANRKPRYLTFITKPISKYHKCMAIQYPEGWKVIERTRLQKQATGDLLNRYVELTPRDRPFFMDWLETKLFPQQTSDWKQVTISINFSTDDRKNWHDEHDANQSFLEGILAGNKSLYPNIQGTIRKISHVQGNCVELEMVDPIVAAPKPRQRERSLFVAGNFNNPGCSIFMFAIAPVKLGGETNRIAHEIFKRLRVTSSEK